MRHLIVGILLWSVYQLPGQPWRNKIEVGSEKSDGIDVMIIMKDQADLSNAKFHASKESRGLYVYEKLWQKARKSQLAVKKILNEKDLHYQSFYLVNMIATTIDLITLEKIARLPSVKSIIENGKVNLLEPIIERNTTNRAGVEWGIDKIGATQVWNMGIKGEGVVVGGQDTGYEWEHPALKNKYRGWDSLNMLGNHDYNWHDAIHSNAGSNPCGADSPFPCDDHNHGTHTMGTMVGDDGIGNQIGVAPDAKWIACRNMDQGNGTLSTYIECFEWFLAPYPVGGTPANGDPAKAPHVINNSWACPTTEGCNTSNFEVMETALMNLRNSGVVIVVSNGNEGAQGCESTFNPPAIFQGSFSVGSTTSSDDISSFSSRGPVTIDGSGRIKPNVVAPGSSVRSCIRNGLFDHYSGTSMAGPHVAGTVALMISANPSLAGRVEVIESILEETAVAIMVSDTCGGLLPTDIPNNVFGYGRIDAEAAVLRAMEEFSENTSVKIEEGDFVFADSIQGVVLVSPDTTYYKLKINNDGKITLINISHFMGTDIILDNSSLSISKAGSGLILISPDESMWRIKVDTNGDIVPEKVTQLQSAYVSQNMGNLIINNARKGLVLKDEDGKCHLIQINDTGDLLIQSMIICP